MNNSNCKSCNTQEEIKAKVNAQVQIIKAIADTIKELRSVPNGHLYAQLMGKMSFESYQKIISLLKNSGLIREESNLLIWNLKI